MGTFLQFWMVKGAGHRAEPAHANLDATEAPHALVGPVTGDDEENAGLTLNGRDYARLRVGEERPPGESPCSGCGAYYFTLHAAGCEDEQCPACGGQLATCACR